MFNVSSPQAEQDLHRSGSSEEEPVYAEASQLLAAETTVTKRDAFNTPTSFPSTGAQDCRAGVDCVCVCVCARTKKKNETAKQEFPRKKYYCETCSAFCSLLCFFL